jgi:hypothetical protein
MRARALAAAVKRQPMVVGTVSPLTRCFDAVELYVKINTG